MLTKNYNQAAANSGTFSLVCASGRYFGGLVQLGFTDKEGRVHWYYRAVGPQPKCRQCRNLKGTLCSPQHGLVCRCGNPYIYRLVTRGRYPPRSVLAGSASVPR